MLAKRYVVSAVADGAWNMLCWDGESFYAVRGDDAEGNSFTADEAVKGGWWFLKNFNDLSKLEIAEVY